MKNQEQEYGLVGVSANRCRVRCRFTRQRSPAVDRESGSQKKCAMIQRHLGTAKQSVVPELRCLGELNSNRYNSCTTYCKQRGPELGQPEHARGAETWRRTAAKRGQQVPLVYPPAGSTLSEVLAAFLVASFTCEAHSSKLMGRGCTGLDGSSTRPDRESIPLL